ncbi:Druantia anti-phage system protein DruA, partial [Planktothrix sp.]|uniref:Druantia anti-phage system protein DruA n=1 Tax=Planktothrix sp. TaxID=3088171 RepID=UPI0038D3A46B
MSSVNEIFFRIARLFWSLPYSNGYGRRMGYLIWDDSNGKLMGILGLQSPPLSLALRDKKFNIPKAKKTEIVNQTMDAYTVGALPPYSDLLAGKLVVLAAASKDVREDYQLRYEGRKTIMENRVIP